MVAGNTNDIDSSSASPPSSARRNVGLRLWTIVRDRCRRLSGGEDQAQPLRAQATSNECQQKGGYAIQPLHVIDQTQRWGLGSGITETFEPQIVQEASAPAVRGSTRWCCR